jgi:hypothetical protein
VGGAAAVLSRGRALALAVLLIALGVYGAVAAELPAFRSRGDLAVVALLVLPAFVAAVWLALPLARVDPPWLLGVGAVLAGLTALGLELVGADSAANVAKFACFVLFGLWLTSFFEEAWWVGLVAALVPWVDIWSVAAGPTSYVVEEQPGFFEEVSVGFALPGEQGSVNLGPPDVIFFTLFLASAARFRLRVGWTWIAMTAFLGVTLLLVWEWDVAGLPALPAVCFGFLVPNADLLWRDLQAARAARRDEATPDA